MRRAGVCASVERRAAVQQSLRAQSHPSQPAVRLAQFLPPRAVRWVGRCAADAGSTEGAAGVVRGPGRVGLSRLSLPAPTRLRTLIRMLETLRSEAEAITPTESTSGKNSALP